MSLEQWFRMDSVCAFAVWREFDGTRHADRVSWSWLKEHFGVII